ncbi:hypothetical protein KSS87_023136, partial [Heliosperma pusillum]
MVECRKKTIGRMAPIAQVWRPIVKSKTVPQTPKPSELPSLSDAVPIVGNTITPTVPVGNTTTPPVITCAVRQEHSIAVIAPT